jgi:hypothetical protein
VPSGNGEASPLAAFFGRSATGVIHIKLRKKIALFSHKREAAAPCPLLAQ